MLSALLTPNTNTHRARRCACVGVRGFSLPELLVALAVLGLLSLMFAWRGFKSRWESWLSLALPADSSVATGPTGPQQQTSSAEDKGPPAARPIPASAPVTLALSGLHKQFGATQIIRGVDLTIRQGERVALIGPNGAGKSTLFNLISGRFEPTSGRVILRGQDVAGLKPQAIQRLGLSRSFQMTHVFGRLSVWDNLRCSVLYRLGHGYRFWRDLNALTDVSERAEQLLDDVRLQHRRHELAMNLTYAEQRALELAVTLAAGNELILLDEPTAGMSRAETNYMIGMIRRLTEGKTLLMVEHDMDVVMRFAKEITVLVSGAVFTQGTPAEIIENADVRRVYLGEHFRM